MRDIRRFCIVYEFFYNYLNLRKELCLKEKINLIYEEEDLDFYRNIDDYSIQVYAINLSIFINFYLRLETREQRYELKQKMNEIILKFDPKFKPKDFLYLPLKEENFLYNGIKLDKGIVKTRFLLENIFSLFVSINTKIPLFIIGKPGFSKTLSVKLITYSMRGSSSYNLFFKKYPRVITHRYNCSLLSTSNGIGDIFKKSYEIKNQLNIEVKEKYISLIFFDDMELAEFLPNNPLNIIHSKLEFDKNEDDESIAFVGISNNKLDYTIVNRGIMVSVLEFDLEDLKETAFNIAYSYDEAIAKKYKSFLENLASCFFEYNNNYLKRNHMLFGKEDFHGIKDFYHLITYSIRKIIEKEKQNNLNNQTLSEIAIDSIEKNFSGIIFDEGTSEEIFKKIFQKLYPIYQVGKKYDIPKKIKENVNDLNDRYLLIASENSIGTVLIPSIFEEEQKCFIYLIGSPFTQDLNSEEYNLRLLNKIQSYMERNIILILKNIGKVYFSLYDLFNQNFIKFRNKNYLSLGIDHYPNNLSYINENFKIIIDIELSKLEEALFANMFEKHIINIEYLLNEELIKEAERIKRNIDEFFECNTKFFEAINFDLKKLMINCNKEEIFLLVYDAYKTGIKIEDINDYVLEKIAMTLPQDILINLKINGAKQNKNLKKILAFYQKGEHSNIYKFLEKAKNQKNIVYTFTNYWEIL